MEQTVGLFKNDWIIFCIGIAILLIAGAIYGHGFNIVTIHKHYYNNKN